MVNQLLKLYTRDLARLKTEIEFFKEEASLWQITGNVKNSAGNLCLHLIGNLNTYIGKNLGKTNYIRNRELEFSQRGVMKEELIKQIIETEKVIDTTLKRLDNQELGRIYPENVLGYEMTTGFFLIHLIGHLSYHLGQINYLRRILE